MLKKMYSSLYFLGEIRECFPTTFKLGRRNNPVKVTDNCQLQRTQNDPNSSIRACICTSDYCNDDLFDNNNQVGGNNNLLCTLFSKEPDLQTFFLTYLSLFSDLYTHYTQFSMTSVVVLELSELMQCNFIW